MESVKNAVIPALIRLQLRPAPTMRTGVPRPRIERIDNDELCQRHAQCVGVRMHSRRYLAQDALHFARLGNFQLAQAVHRIDRYGRLDEEGAACRGLIVNDAADLRAPLAAYRYDVTAFANTDRRILHLEPVRERRHVVLELPDDFCARAAQLAADAAELARRIVTHFATVIDRALDLLL